MIGLRDQINVHPVCAIVELFPLQPVAALVIDKGAGVISPVFKRLTQRKTEGIAIKKGGLCASLSGLHLRDFVDAKAVGL